MCGIAGILYMDPQRTVKIEDLKKMTDSIGHRGPDDEGFYVNGNVGLGFRRLSIIDLTTGHQPIFNEQNTKSIVFNGEVYNYKELRETLVKKGYLFRTQSDTEVVLLMYEEYGEECLQYFRGMFAFAIWDDNARTLFCARDRFGIKPFYYYLDQEKLVFGSEMKSILQLPRLDISLSTKALDNYFTYGYTMGDRSIFTNISKIPAAHFLKLQMSSSPVKEIKPYWELKYLPDFSKSGTDWEEMIREAFLDSVKLHMVSDVPVGAFLSGGIDSSSVVANMSKLSTSKIKTFSIGFEEARYNELDYAREVAKKYGTDHYEEIIKPASLDMIPQLVDYLDEPYADSSVLPSYFLAKLAARHVKVVLTGDGGDELFAGYDHYRKIKVLKSFHLNNFLFRFFFHFLNKAIPEYYYGKGLTFYLSKNARYLGAYQCMWNDFERKKLYNEDFYSETYNYPPEYQKIYYLQQLDHSYVPSLQLLDIRFLLPDDFLVKVDRASMINSLEARVPFLDHKLAELAFTIPTNLQLNKKQQKILLKKSMNPLLPDSVIHHRKQGFAIPITYWFKKDLYDYIINRFNKNNLLNDYINIGYVQDIIHYHQMGYRDFSARIWSLLILEEWFQKNKQYIGNNND